MLEQYRKKIRSYFQSHPDYNALTHWVIGLGIGILITYPLVKTHPLRFGVGIILLGFALHIYPMLMQEKKR